MDCTLRVRKGVERAFRSQRVRGSEWDEKDMQPLEVEGRGPTETAHRASMRPETPGDQEVTFISRQVPDQPVAASFLGWSRG